MKQKTILLTGGTGFLGSNLLQRLAKENYKLILLKRSFSNTFRIKNLLSKLIIYDLDITPVEQIAHKETADIILHCATNYGRQNTSTDKIINANLSLPLQLLDNVKNFGCSCFINTDTIIDKRINHYSMSKKQFKEWLELYSKEIVSVNVELEHFYGPFDDKTKFISFVIEQLKNNVPKIDLTPGEQKRDFIYIDDVVEAFMLIIKNLANLNNNFCQYKIATGRQLSIKETVKIIKRTIGNTSTALNFGALPYRDNELMNSLVDIEKISNLNWQPQYDFKQGIERTLKLENIIQ
jgi:nucleoside-diphosphate-sugar epimerase